MNLQAVEEFINLVKNINQYEKYLKQITDQRKALQEEIAVVGTISEIENLHEKTAELYKKAEIFVVSANEQIKIEREKFEAEYVKRQAHLDGLVSDANRKNAENDRLQKDLTAAYTRAKQAEQEAEEHLKQVKAREAQAEAVIAKYNSKLEILDKLNEVE